jgi:hypothetical protein
VRTGFIEKARVFICRKKVLAKLKGRLDILWGYHNSMSQFPIVCEGDIRLMLR